MRSLLPVALVPLRTPLVRCAAPEDRRKSRERPSGRLALGRKGSDVGVLQKIVRRGAISGEAARQRPEERCVMGEF